MQYAHDRGVLHRDLKPGNIMVGKYGETLVVDWGLAKATDKHVDSGASTAGDEPTLRPASASGSAETLAGSAIGTPAYMSPEQAAGRLDQLGPASDVYSLCSTLFTLLTGKSAVDAKDPIEVVKKVQQGDILRPRAVKPDIDLALEAICMKAMALKAADRYASPHALADDIERWLADNPVSAWPEPWAVRTKRWVRRHQTLVTSSAASLFIALVALTSGLLWYQDEQNRREVEAGQRQAETDRKRLLAEVGIKNALDQAEKPHRDLHAILAKPGGVFGLLKEPARWEAYIQTANSSLRAAQDLLAGAEGSVDPALADRAAGVDTMLRRDESDRLLATKLDKIRADQSKIIENKFDSRGAAEKYPTAFADADPGILDDSTAVVAARLAASPIREQLLAALDNWALVTSVLAKGALRDRLLEIGRLAAPDPTWGDRLRRSEVWLDQQALAKLVKEALGPDHPSTLTAMHNLARGNGSGLGFAQSFDHLANPLANFLVFDLFPGGQQGNIPFIATGC